MRIDILDILKYSAMFDSKEFSEDRDIISLPLALQCIKDNYEISSVQLKEKLNNIFSENYSDTILTLLKDKYSQYCNININKWILTPKGYQLVGEYLKKTDEQDKKLFNILLQYMPETNRGTIVNKYLSFLVKPFTEANQQIKWDGYINLNNDDCMHFIEMIDDIYIKQKEYINIIANTMYGITYIYSYHTQTLKNLEKDENIFLDDMFIENLFGWQAPLFCEPTARLFKLFQDCGYHVKVYDQTLNIIMYTLSNFHSYNKDRIVFDTMYFYMNNQIIQDAPYNPTKILSRETLEYYVKNLNIIIEKFPTSVEEKKDADLYSAIIEARKKARLHGSYRAIVDFEDDTKESAKSVYDDYHYKLILHFGSESNTTTKKNKRKMYLTYKTRMLLPPFYSHCNDNHRVPSICSPATFAIDLFLKQILHHRNDSIDNIQLYLLDIIELYYADSKMPPEISENIRESIQKYPPEEQHQILDRFSHSSEDRKLIREAKGNISEYLKNRENIIQEKDETIITVNSQLSNAIDSLNKTTTSFQDYTEISEQKNNKQIENTQLGKRKKTPEQYLSDTSKKAFKFNKISCIVFLFLSFLIAVGFVYIFFKQKEFYNANTPLMIGILFTMVPLFLSSFGFLWNKNHQLIFQFCEKIEEKIASNQNDIIEYDKKLENLKKKIEKINTPTPNPH